MLSYLYEYAYHNHLAYPMFKAIGKNVATRKDGSGHDQ